MERVEHAGAESGARGDEAGHFFEQAGDAVAAGDVFGGELRGGAHGGEDPDGAVGLVEVDAEHDGRVAVEVEAREAVEAGGAAVLVELAVLERRDEGRDGARAGEHEHEELAAEGALAAEDVDAVGRDIDAGHLHEPLALQRGTGGLVEAFDGEGCCCVSGRLGVEPCEEAVGVAVDGEELAAGLVVEAGEGVGILVVDQIAFEGRIESAAGEAFDADARAGDGFGRSEVAAEDGAGFGDEVIVVERDFGGEDVPVGAIAHETHRGDVSGQNEALLERFELDRLRVWRPVGLAGELGLAARSAEWPAGIGGSRHARLRLVGPRSVSWQRIPGAGTSVTTAHAERRGGLECVRLGGPWGSGEASGGV